MIYVVLTVRNQADTLPSLLERLEALDLPVHVVVVDEASTDGTQALVEGWQGLPGRLRLVQHVRRHGAGRALLAGLRQAVALGGGPQDAVVTLPPGASPDLTPLVRIYRLLEEGMDLVIASRFTPGGGERGLSPWQSFLSRATSQVLRVVFPIAGVTDYTSGYRGVRLAVVQRALEVHGRGLVAAGCDAGPTEFLVRLGRMGVRAAEVPLVLEPGNVPRRGRFGPRALLHYLGMVFRLLRR